MLSTKIHPPRRRDGLLVRPRLLATLAGTAPLVLVTGPAGSGKTVFVRQWLDELDHRAAWLTADPSDNDPVRFWTYLAGAVTATGADLDWAANGEVTAESIEDLAGQLAELVPFAFVLDDVHVLVDGEVIEQLGLLLDAVPHEFRVVLVSRTTPGLRLARRRASGELVELGGRDLLFTEAETAQLLGLRGSEASAGAVQESTGGWPVAVGFATHLPDHNAEAATRSTPTTRSRQQIADYLTQEVLHSQPPDVQQFLLDTSILDELTVASANAIRGATDAITHLHHLERNDIFLTAIDGSDVDTWRHHALVRDHLRRTLEVAHRDRWVLLHTVAARHFAATDPARAIGHALTAEQPDVAAALIQAGMKEPDGIYSRVSRLQLLRWFEALPDALVAESEDLRSTGLGLAAATGRPDLVDRWIAARPPGSVVALEELFTEAWRADAVGDMPRCRDACRRALPLCEPHSVWWHTIHCGLQDSEYMTGGWDAAADSFIALHRPVATLQTKESIVDQEVMRAFPVVIRCRQGNQAAAEAGLGELREWLAEAEGVGYRSCGATAWAEAMTALNAGDVARAARWDTVPDDAVVGESRLRHLVFRLDLARVRRAAGDPVGAAALLAQVRARLGEFFDAGQFPSWVKAEEAALGITAPTTTSAPDGADPSRPITEPLSEREQEVLRMLRSEFSIPEIAAHLFVSYNTAKTHTRTIYRKLGVSSRSAAVARGRVLGYL